MADEKIGLEKPLSPEETAIMRPFATPRLGGSYGYGYGNTEAASGLHLREVMRIIRKRKWLVAVIAAIATILVTVEVFRTPSIYKVSSRVEVLRDSPMIVKAKDQVVQFEDTDSLNTKKIIFTSRPLLEDVVILLQLDQNPKFIESMKKKSVTDAIREITSRVSGKQSVEDSRPENEGMIAGQSIILQDRTAEESQRLSPYVNVLKNKLKVEAVPESTILEVTFEHTDPELATAIVNTAVNNFIQRSWNSRTEKFTGTSDWLERSTRELKAKVTQAEGALAEYTKRNEIFTPDGKQTLTAEKLSALHVQVMKASTDRMINESLYEEVKKGRVNQVPEAFSDPKTATLKQKLGELQVEQSQLSVKYGPENPKVAEVEQKIKVLQGQIADNQRSMEDKLKADYERSVHNEAEMKRALDSAKTETVQQNQAGIRFATLQAELDTARNLYTEFLNKTKQADLQLVEQHRNLKVVETAELPGSPIGPQRFRTILIGFLVSLIAGIGLAFFLEYLDNTVKSVEDIERIAQLPTLAVIPSIATISAKNLPGQKKKGAPSQSISVRTATDSAMTVSPGDAKLTKLVTLDQLSSVVEAYRMLRTSVLLSAAGNPPKTILFTSGQPGEGKTTTAINTAISLSQLGASVLLIDADLRRPTVHRVFKMGQSQGLSTYLSRQVEIDPLINKLWVPNLSVLPCGPIPPNPAELISSERMRLLLRELGQKYDHILIDSPPLINVTDPVILSTMVDGVILVVQAGRSTRDIVRRARQELGSVGAKIFGVVLNNLDIKREGYDSYLATYGNYGYGEKQAARR